MNIKMLKDKILQLAIQGKLVEQNPNDEPVSVLLEKIKAEKEKLIKEKKIKKEKPLPEISEEEKSFEIPDSWEWVRLGNVIQLISGQYMTPSEYNEKLNGIPYITGASNIENEKLIINRWTEFEKAIAIKNDILLTCKGTVGKTIIQNEDKVHIARQIMAIRCREFINNKYVKLFIDSYVAHLQANAKSMIPGIARDDILKIVFPIPPLEEQKRIVEKVNRLFKLVDELDSNKEHLLQDIDNIKNKVIQLAIQGKLVEQNPNDEPVSVLLEKIKAEKEKLIKEKKIKKEKPLPEISEEEKPFETPESWEWVRLGEIGLWGAGATPSRSNPSYYGGNIPWLKTGELKDGYINSAEEFITEEALNKTSVKLNKIGSVLIAMYGATIGRLGILNIEATTNQACCACNTFYGIYNKYLFYYLLSQREELKSRSEGGAQPNISKEKIVRYLIPLPPLEEQKRIVDKIEKLMNYIDRLQDKINNENAISKIVQAKSIEVEDSKELINS